MRSCSTTPRRSWCRRASRSPSRSCARRRRAASKIVGDIEMFARAVRAPVLAVTGTNGKSTVTTLAGLDGRGGGSQRPRRRQPRRAGARSARRVRSPTSTCSSCRAFSSKPLNLSRCARRRCSTSPPDHSIATRRSADYAAAKARIFAQLRAGGRQSRRSAGRGHGCQQSSRRSASASSRQRRAEFGLSHAAGGD